MQSWITTRRCSWGVDVVECGDPDAFLESINWSALKGGRPADAVFEVKN